MGRNGCRVRLFQADCSRGMEALRAGSVSVVVTSPPYNIGASYSHYDDRKPRGEYLDWMGRIGEGVSRVLAGDGSFFLNLGSRPSDPWLPLDVAQRLRTSFVLQNVIHWVKSIAVSRGEMGDYPGARDFSVGHYKPIGGRRFLNDAHEYVFHLTRTGRVPLDRLAVGVPYQDKSNIGRWKNGGRDLRCRGNTWFIPYGTIWNREEQRPHPASFPERLPEMCILLHGLSRTGMVMDPFLGLGNSALAALRLGVSFTGFELDRAYLAEARRRLRAEEAALRAGPVAGKGSSRPVEAEAA